MEILTFALTHVTRRTNELETKGKRIQMQKQCRSSYVCGDSQLLAEEADYVIGLDDANHPALGVNDRKGMQVVLVKELS